jgi:hypothetical protein
MFAWWSNDLPATALAGLAGILSWLFGRQRRGPHLVIGKRRILLREPLRLGRASWQRLAGRPAPDLAEEHAELFRAADGTWEIRLLQGEHLFVDGRRARHNRLRSGAVISLGKSRQATFQFVIQD